MTIDDATPGANDPQQWGRQEPSDSPTRADIAEAALRLNASHIGQQHDVSRRPEARAFAGWLEDIVGRLGLELAWKEQST